MGKKFEDGQLVFVSGSNEWDWKRGSVPSVKTFPPEFRSFLRHTSGFDSRPLKFDESRLTVAHHLRRADLPKGDGRATADWYYYRITDTIRKRFPSADIHVWAAAHNLP